MRCHLILPCGQLLTACHLQGVDIFSKDFLLIPIHDALHWSLIIVCHPGLDFESNERRPYILHLDSMEGEVPCVTSSAVSVLEL